MRRSTSRFFCDSSSWNSRCSLTSASTTVRSCNSGREMKCESAQTDQAFFSLLFSVTVQSGLHLPVRSRFAQDNYLLHTAVRARTAALTSGRRSFSLADSSACASVSHASSSSSSAALPRMLRSASCRRWDRCAALQHEKHTKYTAGSRSKTWFSYRVQQQCPRDTVRVPVFWLPSKIHPRTLRGLTRFTAGDAMTQFVQQSVQTAGSRWSVKPTC